MWLDAGRLDMDLGMGIGMGLDMAAPAHAPNDDYDRRYRLWMQARRIQQQRCRRGTATM